MKTKLRELKPNPVRDFAVDPLDAEIIERLRGSIREHGFWGGVVGRRRNGHIEIGAGHHRIEAAILEGVESGEVHLLDADDQKMVRLYAEENATQRGAAHSTARAGSVAAALRMVAYEVLSGGISQIWEIPGDMSVAQLQANAASTKGIGEPLITKYLEGVSGIRKVTVTADLASLKKSGEYARIIAEVRDRIKAEREEAERRFQEALPDSDAPEEPELEEARVEEVALLQAEAARMGEAEDRAEQAAEKAAEQAPTFDFRGVAAVLKTASHLEAFRDVVTCDYVSPYLELEQQAAVAQRLVALAAQREQELTALFIRTNVVDVVRQLKEGERQFAEADRKRMMESDWRARCKDLEDHYLGGLRNAIMYGGRLLEHLGSVPQDAAIPVRSSHAAVLERAQSVILQIEEKLG